MRRDMELVRSILRDVAESEGDIDARALTDDAHPFETIAYHLDIMDEAGLVRATVKRGGGGRYVLAVAHSLTWEGNDLLSALSNDRLWSEVKKRIAKTLGDASVSTLKALAVKLASDRLMQ